MTKHKRLRNRAKKAAKPARDFLSHLLKPIKGDIDNYDEQLIAADIEIDQCLEMTNPHERAKVALNVVTNISADCAEAYMILAEDAAKTPAEKAEFYRKAASAARKVLGPGVFSKPGMRFTMNFATHTYSTAMEELGKCLARMGETEQAILVFQELIGLEDECMTEIYAAYLAPLFANLGRIDEMHELMSRFADVDDVYPHICYSRALLEYAQHGDTDTSRELLCIAFAMNPFVPACLRNLEGMPKTIAKDFNFDSLDAAWNYVSLAYPGWRRAYGAMQWLREMYSSVDAVTNTFPGSPFQIPSITTLH